MVKKLPCYLKFWALREMHSIDAWNQLPVGRRPFVFPGILASDRAPFRPLEGSLMTSSGGSTDVGARLWRGKAAFVIAHPGHELRLATWIARTGPLVFILAKGARSGRSEARMEASRQLAAVLGATPSEQFGVAFDSEIYSWIMNQDVETFSCLADNLREAFTANRIEHVVTDAWQNYNPVHDLTHALARVAAAEATADTGRRIDVLDYPVVMGPMAHAPLGPQRGEVEQSASDLAIKTALIDQYPDIAEDVGLLDAAVGREAVERETLHDLLDLGTLRGALEEAPWYERYGEERVQAGVYSQVLRWSHMAPIVAMLSDRLAAAKRPPKVAATAGARP